jgi:hypothetical protein
MEDGQDLEGSRARVRFSDAKFVGGGGVVVVVAAAAAVEIRLFEFFFFTLWLISLFHYSVDPSWFFRANRAQQKIIWETLLMTVVVVTNFETHVVRCYISNVLTYIQAL